MEPETRSKAISHGYVDVGEYGFGIPGGYEHPGIYSRDHIMCRPEHEECCKAAYQELPDTDPGSEDLDDIINAGAIFVVNDN